jgi:hypothetical protein
MCLGIQYNQQSQRATNYKQNPLTSQQMPELIPVIVYASHAPPQNVRIYKLLSSETAQT